MFRIKILFYTEIYHINNIYFNLSKFYFLITFEVTLHSFLTFIYN